MMAVWGLYTECNSEPNFYGYVSSKQKAKDWIVDMIEDYAHIHTDVTEHDVVDNGDAMSLTVSDEHYIHAVRLEKI